MPNLYITPAEIKDVAPDSIRAATTKYDDALMRMALGISRGIDQHCMREFWPEVATRYFTALEGSNLEVDDLVSITTLKTDDDGDRTYENTWQATDYDLMPLNERGSYWSLSITPQGTQTFPPKVAKGVEIAGVWFKTDDRTRAWEDTGQTVQDNPLSDSATELTVTDIDAAGIYSVGPVINVGSILRIESEYVEVTAVNTGTNKATIIRAVNGSTAAAHAQGTTVEVFRPMATVGEAAMIEVVRIFQRATQGFADARANPELGELVFTGALDPKTTKLLQPLVKLVHSDVFHV